MLHDVGAGFDEIPGVDIGDPFEVADHGMMDVAADHAVGAAPSRFVRERRFERADEIDGVLDLQLGPGGERPIGEAEPTSDGVEMGVDEDREIVGPVAEEGEPFGMTHDQIEFIAVHDKINLAVRRFIFGVADDFDAAEGQSDKLTREFVVIAGHEDHPRATSHLSQ